MSSEDPIYLIVIVTIFAVWLILSAIFQFDRPWFQRIATRDYFGFLPRWTFFAPNPGTTDYHLLYRDRLPDGSFSDWVEIPVTPERRLISCVWNPDKRSKKVQADAAMMLIETAAVLPPKSAGVIVLSLPYLLLLNVTLAHSPAAPGALRQFVIAETLGSSPDPARLLMKSSFHACGLEEVSHAAA